MELEEMYKKLDEFMKNRGEMSEEEALKEFMRLYNNKELDMEDTDDVKAISLLEEAMEEEDDKKAKALAKKALKLDPNNADVKLFLLNFEDENGKIKKYDKIILETEDYLRKKGFFDRDNIGEFYMLFETRPYMRVLFSKASFLLERGMIESAREVLEKIINFNENDNLGARYLLAGVYAYFEDKDELNKLTKKYSNDFGIEFDLAKMILAYKEDNETKALRCLKNIDKKNHNFIKVMTGKVNEKELFENMNLGYYSPGDLSEVLKALSNFSFVLLPMTMFPRWVNVSAKKLK